MKHCIAGISAGVIALTIATSASASTASQREYKRGYADCAAGRWDDNQHGASYKKGCRAAEDKRDASGRGAAASHQAAPAAEQARSKAGGAYFAAGEVATIGGSASDAVDAIVLFDGLGRGGAVGRVGNGRLMTVDNCDGDWCHVRTFSGASAAGWIEKRYLRRK